MNTKAMFEKKEMLVAELEEILNTSEVENRNFNEEEQSKIAQLKEEIRALELQNKKLEERGSKNMEIRELLVNGEEINVRADEVTNANVGMEKVEYLAGIIEKVADVSPLFEKANKINTTSNSAITVQGTKLPKFVKTAELQEYTKKAMTYEEKVLKADKYGLCVVVSEECLEDNGYDLEADIKKQMVEGLGLTLNEIIVQKLEGAVGAKKPTIAALDADGIVDMYYALPAGYRTGAVFVISPEHEVEIAKLKDANGMPLMTRTYTDRPVAMIMGCEVIVDANVTKPMFVNLDKAIVVGLRHNLNIKRDDSIGFLSGTVAFRADCRLDAVTIIEEAIVVATVGGLRAKK
ncbi:MAG: phage major capsid protein [Clostridium celatum]|nr:phage major capsid protein [Clostridium celatum]